MSELLRVEAISCHIQATLSHTRIKTFKLNFPIIQMTKALEKIANILVESIT